MAKSARASSKKRNHTKLRARVFGPVEQARAERLHAKMLETINAPKAEKAAAEESELITILFTATCADTHAATTDATKEEDLPKGSSFMTAAIPPCLSESGPSNTRSAQEQHEISNLCFHLGICSDIMGFNDEGHLELAFDPLPPRWLSEDQGLTVSA